MEELSMADHFNNLSPDEAERLALLAEECGEVIVAVGKILRHGYNSFDPTLPIADRIINREALAKEMGDVRAAMILLCNAGDIKKDHVHSWAAYKLDHVSKWMHHQPSTDSGGSEHE